MRPQPAPTLPDRPRLQRQTAGAHVVRRLVDDALAASLPVAAVTARTTPPRIQRVVRPEDVGALDTEVEALHRAKNGGKAFKADFEPIAAKIGNGCTWNDVKAAYTAYSRNQQAPAEALPVRQVTRTKLTSVTSGESGGQRYTKTKTHAGLEYHVSVEYEPTSTTPAERNTCPVRIKKLHVSVEEPGNTQLNKKDRYWYHWTGGKFAFDERTGRKHADMRAKADAAVQELLPKLNCPPL